MDRKSGRNITTLLVAWRAGDADALVELMPLVYRELRGIARHLLRREAPGQLLDTSALVHEAYLRLIEIHAISWESRLHFYSMCARIMRRVLVDQARHQRREKRDAGARVDEALLHELADLPAPHVVAVDEALRELAKHDAELAHLVELRFFGGLERNEIAEILGISSATVTRRWLTARAWLIHYLARPRP